jgi:hypothetical protein
MSLEITVPKLGVNSCTNCKHSMPCPNPGFLFCREGPTKTTLFRRGIGPQGQPDIIQQVSIDLTPVDYMCSRWKTKIVLPG